MTRDCVAHLRAVQGRETDSPALAEVVRQLCSESTEFIDLWMRYDVVFQTAPSSPDHPAMTLLGLVGDGAPEHREGAEHEKW